MRAATSRPLLALACILATCLAVGATDSTSANEKLAKYNARVGAAFLAEHLLEPNVRVLPSGVHYRVIEDGEGQFHPTRNCQVLLHHAGKDIRGRVFEDTWEARPEELTVGGTLASWQHALERMVEGDVWEIATPSKLAYAEHGVARDKIGPGETLMFKLKLVRLLCPAKDQVPRNWVHPPVNTPPAAQPIRVQHKKGSKARPLRQPKDL